MEILICEESRLAPKSVQEIHARAETVLAYQSHTGVLAPSTSVPGGTFLFAGRTRTRAATLILFSVGYLHEYQKIRVVLPRVDLLFQTTHDWTVVPHDDK